MLRNLQEIMGGDIAHALVRLWSDELSEAEAMAVHSRRRSDPKYREELDELLAVFDGVARFAGDRRMEAIATDFGRLLQERRRNRRFALGLVAAMLVAIGAVLALSSPWRGPDESHLQKYFTRIGEQQTIELADGSVITLNTGGQLVVDYSRPERRVLLERGEAFFEVAEDPDRPFRVGLGTHAVTVLGTEFNVLMDPGRYQVAVIEGAVTFHEVTDDLSASSPPVSMRGPGPRRVEAGWVAEYDVSRKELTAFQPESMDRYRDWRSGLLSFSYEPLSQVVRELNRYSRRKILIEDASVMDLSVYTVVRVTEIDGALQSLEQVLPIEVTRHYDRIVISASTGNDG
ncbi:MAG: FecR domain-containing protein [Gammaproteobacteria bacterium]|nr:FecR domain-containing protein [Gammaproteobacteria bacterium]